MLREAEMNIGEMKYLKDGWLDGKGRAPNAGGLEWVNGILEQICTEDIPLPYLYRLYGLTAEEIELVQGISNK